MGWVIVFQWGCHAVSGHDRIQVSQFLFSLEIAMNRVCSALILSSPVIKAHMSSLIFFLSYVCCKGLTHFDVDTFVDEVLVQNQIWLSGR